MAAIPLPSPPLRAVLATGVVVAEGQALVRAGLRSLLDAESDIAVLGEAGTAQQTRELILRARPSVASWTSPSPASTGSTAPGG